MYDEANTKFTWWTKNCLIITFQYALPNSSKTLNIISLIDSTVDSLQTEPSEYRNTLYFPYYAKCLYKKKLPTLQNTIFHHKWQRRSLRKPTKTLTKSQSLHVKTSLRHNCKSFDVFSKRSGKLQFSYVFVYSWIF